MSGWGRDDFVGTGEAVRQTALAMMTANPSAPDATWCAPPAPIRPTPSGERPVRGCDRGRGDVRPGVVLDAAPDLLLQRLHARPETPVTAVVSRIIAERGGDPLVLQGRQQLLDLAEERGWLVVDTTDREGGTGRPRAGRGRVSQPMPALRSSCWSRSWAASSTSLCRHSDAR